eukprot:250614_1
MKAFWFVCFLQQVLSKTARELPYTVSGGGRYAHITQMAMTAGGTTTTLSTGDTTVFNDPGIGIGVTITITYTWDSSTTTYCPGCVAQIYCGVDDGDAPNDCDSYSGTGKTSPGETLSMSYTSDGYVRNINSGMSLMYGCHQLTNSIPRHQVGYIDGIPNPTSFPTMDPTIDPTAQPTLATDNPSSLTSFPTTQPSDHPSNEPSYQPSQPSNQPSYQPSQPSNQPSVIPTVDPTARFDEGEVEDVQSTTGYTVSGEEGEKGNEPLLEVLADIDPDLLFWGIIGVIVLGVMTTICCVVYVYICYCKQKAQVNELNTKQSMDEGVREGIVNETNVDMTGNEPGAQNNGPEFVRKETVGLGEELEDTEQDTDESEDLWAQVEDDVPHNAGGDAVTAGQGDGGDQINAISGDAMQRDICSDCGKGDFGKIFGEDGLFYCNECWVKYGCHSD